MNRDRVIVNRVRARQVEHGVPDRASPEHRPPAYLEPPFAQLLTAIALTHAESWRANKTNRRHKRFFEYGDTATHTTLAVTSHTSPPSFPPRSSQSHAALLDLPRNCLVRHAQLRCTWSQPTPRCLKSKLPSTNSPRFSSRRSRRRYHPEAQYRVRTVGQLQDPHNPNKVATEILST